MEKLRVGFIGVGGISRLHYLGYKDNPHAELYSICDTDEKQLQQRQADWGVQRAHTDYRELLADPKVDAVEIMVPHHLHALVGVAALQAGKHVSMQKPMAVNAEECDALIEAARRSGTLFRVFENFRYYPPLVKAKELLDSGAIGEPLSIRLKVVQGSLGKDWKVPYSRWAWRFDAAQCGGGRVVFDYGYHLFSIAMWFLGEVEKVSAWITHRPIRPELAGRGVGLIRGVDHAGGVEREDASASDKAVVPLRAEEVPGEWLIDSPAVAIWKYRNAEKYGSYEAITSYDILVRSKYTPEDEWVELTGSRGFIWVNRCTSMLLDRPPVVMYRDGVVTEFSDMDSDWAASFVAGMQDFAEAIVHRRQPGLTGEEGKKVLQFCQAVQLSAKEGRTVCPEEIN
jgi:predicted dehydrogenase